MVIRNRKNGIPLSNIFFMEPGERDMIQGSRLLDTRNDGMVGFSGIEQPNREVQLLSACLFQLAPVVVRKLKQGNVVGMFKICTADDPALTGMRPFFVRNRELLDSQDPLSALRQMIAGGSAHGAYSGHNHIVGRGSHISKEKPLFDDAQLGVVEHDFLFAIGFKLYGGNRVVTGAFQFDNLTKSKSLVFDLLTHLQVGGIAGYKIS